MRHERLRGYAFCFLDLLYPRARSPWVQSADVSPARHAVELGFARAFAIETATPYLTSKHNGKMFLSVYVVTVHVEPHFVARRGRYACAYIALDYREFFKKFGLGRIGGEGGVDWDGARGPWCGCPRGCGGE